MRYFLILIFIFSFNSFSKSLPCNGEEGHYHSNGGGFVSSNATVSSEAFVNTHAEVCEYARVLDDVRIEDSAIVSGRSLVSGNSVVWGSSKVYGRARVLGNSRVGESAEVLGNATVKDRAVIAGNAKINSNAIIYGTGSVCDDVVLGAGVKIGEGSKYCKTLTPVPPPVRVIPNVVLTADKLSGPAPLTVNFDGSSSSSANGKIKSYIWFSRDSGDDATVTERPFHSYTFKDPGVHEFTLYTSDEKGGSSEKSIHVSVLKGREQSLFAKLSFDKSEDRLKPLDISFTGLMSRSSNSKIIDYSWKFGDGQIGKGKHITHSYSKPGEYNVSLTVMDSLGQRIESEPQLITVNCDREEGDNLCIYMNQINKFVDLRKESTFFSIANGKLIKQNSYKITLESQENFSTIDITNLITIHGDAFSFNNTDFLDFIHLSNTKYNIIVNGFDFDNNQLFGRINNLLFGKSTLRFTSPIGGRVNVKNVDHELEYSIIVEANVEHQLDSLPYGWYSIDFLQDEKFDTKSIDLDANDLKSVIFSPYDPFHIRNQQKSKFENKKEREFVLSEEDRNSNFKPLEIVFSPEENGITKKDGIYKVKSEGSALRVAFKVKTLNAISNDTFKINIQFRNEKGKYVNHNISKTFKNALGSFLKEGEEVNLSSSWNEIGIDTSSLQEGDLIYYSIEVENKGRTFKVNNSCISALLFSVSESPNLPYIKKVSRVYNFDGNKDFIPMKFPINNLIPVQVDNIKGHGINGKHRNQFHGAYTQEEEVDHHYYLVWKVKLELFKDSLSSESSGIQVFVSDADKDDEKGEQVPADMYRSADIENDERYVMVRIRSFRELDLFKSYFSGPKLPIRSPDRLKFKFRISTHLNKFSALKSYESNLRLLYNAKNLVPESMLEGGRISMYTLKHVYNKLNEMVSGDNLKDRLLLNDISLPYGGYFYPHSNHQDGLQVDMKYPDLVTNARTKEINRYPSVRINEMINYQLYPFESTVSPIQDWAQSVSKGLELMNVYNTDWESILLSYGGKVDENSGVSYFPDFDDWNKRLLGNGEIISSLFDDTTHSFSNYRHCEVLTCFNSSDSILINYPYHLNHIHLNYLGD